MHKLLKPTEKILRSHSSKGQKALVKPSALFSSEQGNMIRSSVFRNANPSNLRRSLLEGSLAQSGSGLAAAFLCEVFRIVLQWCFFDLRLPWTVKLTGFMIIIISLSLRASLVFVTDRGLLGLILVILFVVVASTFTRAFS